MACGEGLACSLLAPASISSAPSHPEVPGLKARSSLPADEVRAGVESAQAARPGLAGTGEPGLGQNPCAAAAWLSSRVIAPILVPIDFPEVPQGACSQKRVPK